MLLAHKMEMEGNEDFSRATCPGKGGLGDPGIGKSRGAIDVVDALLFQQPHLLSPSQPVFSTWVQHNWVGIFATIPSEGVTALQAFQRVSFPFPTL